MIPRFHLVSLSAAVLSAVAVCALPNHGFAQDAPYVLSQEVLIGGPDKWDLLTYDPPTHRVYIAHSTETTIVDTHAGKVVGRLQGLAGAHGQAVRASTGQILADSGVTGTVTLFDPVSLKPVKTVQAAPDADVMIFDPASRRVFVMNGDSQSMTVIDADDRATTLPLGGGPEAAAVDGRGQLFVNMESTQEILRIDTAAAKITARWRIPTCTLPHGMAIDVRTHRLFTSCENSRLIVTDFDDGHLITSLPIGKWTDGAAFDPQRHRIFSSNGDGTLSVIQEVTADKFVPMATVQTVPGARTMAIDPKSGRLFLVAAHVIAVGPPKQPGGPPKFTYAPDSEELFILCPSR